jgi:hypothetical protein
MNALRAIGHYLGKSVIWFDRAVNWTVGRCSRLWSDYGGETNETISHTLGLEEAEALYKCWLLGIPLARIKDVHIEDKHRLGEFSSDLCDLFQRYHALRSINWKKEPALQAKYPGIRDVVEYYLRSKGVKP